MPVIDKLLVIGLAALAMVLAVPAHAARPASPPQVLQILQQDLAVMKAAKHYNAVSQLMMLYYLCPTEYKVDAAKQAFADTTFNELSHKYLDAFLYAHKTRTGKMPSDELLGLIRDHMAAKQAEAKTSLRQRVEQQGCGSFALQQMDLRWNAARANREKAAAMAASTTTETAPAPTEPTTKN